MAENNFVVDTFADTMEITPAQILTFLLVKFHEQTDPQKQRGYGMRFINAAKGILQFEYKKRGKEFEMPSHWWDLYDEIIDLDETIGRYGKDGQFSQSQKICSKMARLVDDYLLYELQGIGVLFPELAEERIDVRGKSGQSIGYRIPVKISKSELQELNRKRVAEKPVREEEEE